MSWLDSILPPRIKSTRSKKSIPEGLWRKCTACDEVLFSGDLEVSKQVCPKCSHHFRIGARSRIEMLLDSENREEIGSDILPKDPLGFVDTQSYPKRLKKAKDASGETDALVVMQGQMESIPVVLACFEFSFMGGSMGSVVGERFYQGVRKAIEKRTPFICVSASGGARMQEGLFSLMQMSKTVVAVKQLEKEKLPFISVLTDPTMGGVSASFAFLGDVVMAEPGALIGFAGPRVIQQTVGTTLPEGFQRAEFLLEKGALHMIVDRRDLKEKLVSILSILLQRSLPEQ